MSKVLLKVADLHTWYGESHVLHGINFEIREGELVTLLGRNGAGRTTTVKSILGLVSTAWKPSRCRPTKSPVSAWATAPKSAEFFRP